MPLALSLLRRQGKRVRGALLRRTFGPEGGGGLWHKQHHAHSPPAQCPQTYAVRRRRKDGTLERSRRRRKGPLLEEAVSQKFCLLKELLETPSPFSPLSVLRFLRLLLRRQSLSSSIFPSLACQCHRRRQCQLKTLLCLLLFPTPPSLDRDGSLLLVERRQNPSDQVSRSTFAGATWIEGEGERDLSSHQDVGEEDERKGSWLGDFGKEKGGSGILA